MNPARLALPAAALSFLVPGFGQFLLRAWGRGAIWLASWLVLGGLTSAGHGPIVLVLMLIAAVDAYAIAGSQTTVPRGPSVLGLCVVVVLRRALGSAGAKS